MVHLCSYYLLTCSQEITSKEHPGMLLVATELFSVKVPLRQQHLRKKAPNSMMWFYVLPEETAVAQRLSD